MDKTLLRSGMVLWILKDDVFPPAKKELKGFPERENSGRMLRKNLEKIKYSAFARGRLQRKASRR